MPSFTFYATAEAALVLGARPVFCDIDPDTFCVTRETRRGGADAAHEGDRAGAPVRQRRARARSCASSACRWSRTRRRRRAPRSAARGRARSATPRRSRSSRRRTCPASATAARSPRTTTSSPSGRASFASTGRRTRPPSPRWAGTRASTSSRRRCCACCCPSSTGGSTGAARRRPPTRASASASTWRCPRRPTAPGTPTTSTSSAPSASCPVGRGYYRTPVHRQPAIGAGRRAAGHRGGGAHQLRPADGHGPHRGPGAPGRRNARLGRPDEQPARARHAPADRGDARGRARGGGHRARLRADARAVRALRHRRTRRSGATAASGSPRRRLGLVRRSGALARWARGRRLRRRDRPRLERRERGGARCCASRPRPRSTTSSPRSSTT